MRRAALLAIAFLGLFIGTPANAQTIPQPVLPGAGTVLTFNNPATSFRCTRPLVEYAVRGLPLIIEHTTTRAASLAWPTNGAVRLETGCRGDGNPATIDLVLHLNGNGLTMGSAGDGLVLAGGDDIVIGPGAGEPYSWVDCGGGGAQGGHEDAFRANRGTDLTLYRVRSGDWGARRATCHGAGGNVYLDNVNGDTAGSQRVVCIQCLIVASKGWYDDAAGDVGVGLGLGWSTDSGAYDSCFMAVRPIFQYVSGGSPISVRPINVRNFGVRFVSGTNTVAPGSPVPADCPLLDGGPPPPPPPDPVDPCQAKLTRINTIFHRTNLSNATKLSRIHSVVHEIGDCTLTGIP